MNKSKSFNILLIEDNPGDIRLTKEALKDIDKSVNLSVALDGAEAINYLLKAKGHEGSTTPDLILLDLNLPKKDGKEVLKEIKKNPDLLTIPVIILSTSNAEKDILECYQLHANSFINKPVDFDEFFEVINKLIEFWFDLSILASTINK
jgi:CheY-like chemotaxis protein